MAGPTRGREPDEEVTTMDQHADVRIEPDATATTDEVRTRLPFRFDLAHRPVAAGWGITDDNAYVDVTADRVDVRFGPWRLTARRGDIVAIERTGALGHRETTAPPAVVGADHELVFGTNDDGGIRLRFREPVRCVDPIGPWAHEAIVVTVADPDAAERLLAPPA
jgi:hypothetical protein